jgi:hypothetical protein
MESPMSLFEVAYRLSLIGTFFVLIWYTKETWQIRKINQQQMDLQLLPAMMLYLRRDPESSAADPDHYRLTIRNIGHGAATEVRLKDVKLKIENKMYEFKFELADQNDTLIADEEREVEIDSFLDGKSNYQNRMRDFHDHFSPYSLTDIEVFRESGQIDGEIPITGEIEIGFKDINNQMYETTIGFSSRGVSIIKSPIRSS